MMTGKVKTYFEDRGFGFISPEDGGKDVFVHVKAVKSGADRLCEGAEVEFELGSDRERRVRAVKVSVIG